MIQLSTVCYVSPAFLPSQAFSPSTGVLTGNHAGSQPRNSPGGRSAAPLPTGILAQPSPPSPRGWLRAILPEVCTAACLGLFPSLFSSAFPRQAASHPEPKSQQELSQQPGRDDDIPTAFPGKHFMGRNESNSKGHQSQACSMYRGFSKMCQFI